MRTFGLIGFPLSHSFSKIYFDEKFHREKITDATYELYPLKSIDAVPALLQTHPDLQGLNVTIPYKQEVLSLLSSIDSEAKQIGAVNCIHIHGTERIGYNTDAYGFQHALKGFLEHTPEQAFVLGTGGSSLAVAHVLKIMNIPHHIVSRHPASHQLAYEEIGHYLKTYNLFVNCTPLGMFPNTNSAPAIPYRLLSQNDYLFDLVYNPEETVFLMKGTAQGARTKNGMEMLQLQAEKSWEIWNNATS